ncbi:MAG: glycosyltransferase family 39 protein, partial [Chloroflexi bacterium]|nr:glycosyltransferase family 39 protein [Chloroflexota bacterium]
MRTPAAVAAPGQRQRTLAVCAALVLLAFALRVAGVQRQDLWGDEAFSVRFSAQALPQIVQPGVETHPPLYHALLHYWMAAAGNRPLAVRYLSVLTGTLLVATCCNLGRSVFPRAVGVTTAAVASVSAFGIYYSQEARMYALAALLCALATLLVLRHQARPRQTERLWAWLLAVTLALFTHY